MICFRDMTFCGSDCTNSECPRHFSDADWKAAKTWWGKPSTPDEHIPIAWSDFSETCPDYRPPKRHEPEGVA